jgi:hypothetical protein
MQGPSFRKLNNPCASQLITKSHTAASLFTLYIFWITLINDDFFMCTSELLSCLGKMRKVQDWY